MSRFVPWAHRAAAAAALVVLAASGCNVKKLTANTTAKNLEFGSVAMDREADLEFARYAFPASLKTIETFLVSSPDNKSLLVLLARGYNAYAFGIIEADLEHAQLDGPEHAVESLSRRAKIHYLRGREYGFRWLARPALEEAAKKGDLETLDAELGRLKKEDVPGLFWAVYGWASAVNLAVDDPEMVAGLPSIERMMNRALELDPDYNAGAPYALVGVYHASKPPALGGEPQKAKAIFDQGMAAHGQENLLLPYLYARFYAPMVQDRALFDEMIGKVADADVTAHPDLRLTNEIARDRARFWATHVDEIILSE
ncbi:TRAP transporter TatT component family protein [Paraliomyxa miuraensis]|uniref:TRAP transporter TatT component family protein n=1 Tax=Paraliomyxa miuraensis TaxID=376150 RepID=UPI002255188B|nr:TRAP transporter TatT component family protein [Paraliomyxa miuraensis]MCX4240980.1 TRAP transporter TatT component family protein [Paraliomyxa miuraensis]